LKEKLIGQDKKKELKGKLMVWRIEMLSQRPRLFIYLFIFLSFSLFKFCENERHAMD